MQQLLDIGVVFMGWAMVACYVWSMRRHFVSEHFPLGAKIISAGAVGGSIALTLDILAHEQSPAALAIGLLLQVASAALFWWAVSASRTARLRYAFDPEAPRGLVTGGPYQWTRHPFYTSYLLFWTGWAVASGSLWAAAVLAFFAFVYTTAALGEEELFEQSDMAGAYRRYREKAGLFWPRFTFVLWL